MTNFCVYNVHGGTQHIVSGGSPFAQYIKDTVLQHDVTFLTETWLHKKELHLLQNLIGPTHSVTSVSSMPLDYCNRGRPYGGMSIVWRNTCKCIPIDSNSRDFCAARLGTDDGAVLLICAYLPCHDIDKYRSVLAAITAFISDQPDNHVIIGGDFNADPNTPSLKLTLLNQFCSPNLEMIDKRFSTKIPFTYTSATGSSWVDHLLISDSISSHVISCWAEIRGDELSDHVPLITKSNLIPTEIVVPPAPKFRPKPAWYRVSQDDVVNFNRAIANNLPNFPAHLSNCTRPNCIDSKCLTSIDLFSDALISTITTASMDCLPHTKPKSHRKKKLIGWTVEHQTYKDDLNRWSNYWQLAGYPKSGVMFDLYKHLKHQYKAAIKDLRLKQFEIRRARMADNIAGNPAGRDLFDEMRRLKGSVVPSVIVDNFVDKKSIANAFRKNYAELYSSLPSGPAPIIPISTRTLLDFKITAAETTDAIKLLNLGKSDSHGIFSNHLKLCSSVIAQHLADLLTTCIRHSTLSPNFSDAVICPIPKKHKQLHLTGSYRAIAMGSIFSKVGEILSMFIAKHTLDTSPLQFAYKKGLSTTMCTGLVTATVQHYNNNGSQVYAALLDMSKAFDMLKFDRLFDKTLKERGFPNILRKFFSNWYRAQHLKVRWENETSDPFEVWNGARQGGITSAQFFTAYVDELQTRLKSLNVGCHVDGEYVGSPAYADDIILLAPSLSALRLMLKTCEDFSEETGLVFNPLKSQLISFGNYDNNQTGVVSFCNQQLNWADTADHLGHILPRKSTDVTADVARITNSLQVSTHTTNSAFKFASSRTRMKLHSIYSTSFYGAILLPATSLKPLRTAWNIIIRRSFSLPNRCHSGIAHIIAKTEDVINMVGRRFITYAKACLESTNITLRRVMDNAKRDLRTTFGKNFEEYGAQLHTRTYSPTEIDRAQMVSSLLFEHGLREFLGIANIPVLVMLLCT